MKTKDMVLFSLQHPVRRQQNSNCSVNSFEMVVYEDIFNCGLFRKFWLNKVENQTFKCILSHLVRRRHARCWARGSPILVHKYVDHGSATMLATKRPASVTPEVHLKNLLHIGDAVCKGKYSPWLWNPGRIPPEVQNRGISHPTKKD